MIIESILDLWFDLYSWLIGLLPDVPDFNDLTSSLDKVFSLIMSNLQLIDIFIRPSTIRAIAPLMIIITNFEHIWEFIMFIVRKIPFSID